MIAAAAKGHHAVETVGAAKDHEAFGEEGCKEK